jgi:hypothetical protein
MSTTVDAALLENAWRLRSELTDASLVDEALEALLAGTVIVPAGKHGTPWDEVLRHTRGERVGRRR